MLLLLKLSLLQKMIEVTIKYIFGDYMIPWEEQEYHDERVSSFKWGLKKIIESYNAQTIRPLIVDCEYYPAIQKFKIVNFTQEHQVRIEYILKMNSKFVKEYLK